MRVLWRNRARGPAARRCTAPRAGGHAENRILGSVDPIRCTDRRPRPPGTPHRRGMPADPGARTQSTGSLYCTCGSEAEHVHMTQLTPRAGDDTLAAVVARWRHGDPPMRSTRRSRRSSPSFGRAGPGSTRRTRLIGRDRDQDLRRFHVAAACADGDCELEERSTKKSGRAATVSVYKGLIRPVSMKSRLKGDRDAYISVDDDRLFGRGLWRGGS